MVYVWHHVIDGYFGVIPCWTYVSRGMAKVNQPELVITLRRRQSENEDDCSLEPLDWFKMVYAWGKKGQIIDPYHTHEAHSEHWLGSNDLETITYGMPIHIPGFARGFLPTHRLHGVALTSEEAQIAKAYGYTRVIGNIGLKHRWFPYQPWIDRDRGDCFTWAQTEGTIRQLTFNVTQKIRGVNARREGTRTIFEIPAGREKEVRVAAERTTPGKALTFDSVLHPNADACFVWEKGNTQQMIYSIGG